MKKLKEFLPESWSQKRGCAVSTGARYTRQNTHILLTHQLTDIGLFLFWEVMNNAAMNFHAQVCVNMSSCLSGRHPGVGLLVTWSLSV